MLKTKNRVWVSLFFVFFSCDRVTKRISEFISGGVHIVSWREGWHTKNRFSVVIALLSSILFKGGDFEI